VRDADFVSELLSNGEGQCSGLGGYAAAGTDTDHGESNEAGLPELDGTVYVSGESRPRYLKETGR
jgi:hypothetical protein